MNSKYPCLTQPMTVKGVTFRNRMAASPMMVPELRLDGTADPMHVGLFRQKAEGGSALVTVGEVDVDHRFANREHIPWMEKVDYSDLNSPFLAGFRAYADAIHSSGAVAMIQINHAGESKFPEPGDEAPRGPMSYRRADGVDIVAMDEEVMAYTVEHFASCARFMREAGFDGVQIHCGHGWLLHQFLSPRTNRRADAYGGSRENRERFPLMVLRAVRQAVGPDFLVEIRVSGEERMPGGSTAEDMASFCAAAQPYIDMIHVSAGIYREPVLTAEFSSMFHPQAVNARAAAVIRAAVDIPVGVVGGISDPDTAEAILAAGQADYVALGRELFADVQFPNKVMEGREREIFKCLRCFRCFSGPIEDMKKDSGLTAEDAPPPPPGCSINPEFGSPVTLASTPPPARKKRVLVVGGGAAGLQAAVTAAKRGHSVTLAEQANRLGGVLKFARYDAHKTRFLDLCDTYAYELEQAGGTLLLNTKVDQAFLEGFDPDAVIIAVGSSPIHPAIPGLDEPQVVDGIDAYAPGAVPGDPVVVLGGGLVGCETALQLAEEGKSVTVVEMRPELCPDGYKLHRVMLLAELARRGVTCLTGFTCKEVRPGGVLVTGRDGHDRLLPAPGVVNALGMAANAAQARDLVEWCGSREHYIIGDCVRAGKLYDAVRSGFETGLKL